MNLVRACLLTAILCSFLLAKGEKKLILVNNKSSTRKLNTSFSEAYSIINNDTLFLKKISPSTFIISDSILNLSPILKIYLNNSTFYTSFRVGENQLTNCDYFELYFTKKSKSYNAVIECDGGPLGSAQIVYIVRNKR